MPTGGIDIAAIAAAAESAAASVGAGLTAAGSAIGGGLGALGVGAETAGAIGTGLVDAGVGAGLGATEAAITGGNPATGAELGGITGGAIGGVGPVVGNALGSTTLGDALAGAAGGAVGGAATGGNVIQSTLGGAASGAVAGQLSGSSSSSPTTGANVSAGGGAAPPGVAVNPDVSAPAPAPTDVTTANQFPTGVNGQGSAFNTSVSDAIAPSSVTPASPAQDTGSFSTQGQTTVGSAGPMSTPPGANSPQGSFLNSINSASDAGSSTTLPGGQSGTSGNISGSGNITGNASDNISGGGTSGAGADAAKPSAFSTAIDNPTRDNIGKALGANAGLLTSGAGLGKDIITALTPDPNAKALSAEAKQLQQLGTQNASYLQSGTLPAGQQALVNQTTQAALAAIRSRYAAMGMSGSSAEAQDLQNAMVNAQTSASNLAMQLMQQGVSELGASSQIYNDIIKNTMAQDEQFASAFTNLASQAGGGGSGETTTGKNSITLNIPKTGGA